MEIIDYEDYLIYPDGRVYSNKSKRWRKAHPNCDGYLQLGLSNKDGYKMFRVNRLVAIHYIPNPHNYPCVDHIDRDRLNNHLYNLRWVTCQENSSNLGMYKTNKSGHKNISFDKSRNRWAFEKIYYGKTYRKTFKSKIDALCYKYIVFLKIRASRA
jgi:hypothetical protein